MKSTNPVRESIETICNWFSSEIRECERRRDYEAKANLLEAFWDFHKCVQRYNCWESAKSGREASGPRS